MTGNDQTVDQRLIIGGEAVVERADIAVPLLLGTGARDDRGDERGVQHPGDRELAGGDALFLGVALDLLRELERFRPPFGLHHVRVNAILPGLMKTPMVEHSAGLASSYAKGDVEAMWRARDAQVPMGHMGDAWDVANAALFLASDESKYVTGIELVVDGGITCKAGA